MTETTHEALIRQTASAEELLGYFQGQRDQFNQNVADAQADYAALSANLVGIITDRMHITITFDPNAAEADLSHNGVFRNWTEFLNLNLGLPQGADVRALMTPGDTLEVDGPNYDAGSYGDRHWDFRATSNQVAGARPVVKIMCYDKVSYNQWRSLHPGSNGSVNFQYVDIEIDTDTNSSINASTANRVFQASMGRMNVILDNCKVTGPPETDLMMVSYGGGGTLTMRFVELDGVKWGLNKYSTVGVGILSANSVTLTNGSVLYDTAFTIGTDLLVG